MTLQADMDRQHEDNVGRHSDMETRDGDFERLHTDMVRAETSVTVKMSTVLTILVGLLSIAATITNVWLFSMSKTIEINGNRITALEQTQMAQDKTMERFFRESEEDRKEIKSQLKLYTERQLLFLNKLGIKVPGQ
jgi:hypothetical protein